MTKFAPSFDTILVQSLKLEVMAKKIDLDKHIWEGWCVRHFIQELQPCMDMVFKGESWHKPFKTRADIREYTMNYQPYYKKPITDVIEYFCQRYGIK